MLNHRLAERHWKILTLKSVTVSPLMRANEYLWDKASPSMKSSTLGVAYGNFMNRLIKRSVKRNQNISTTFLRNRQELKLLKRLVGEYPPHSPIKILVLGCSEGAEPYCISQAIQSIRSDLKLEVLGMDISRDALRSARSGFYEKKNSAMFARLNPDEFDRFFDDVGGFYFVKSGISGPVSFEWCDVLKESMEEYLRAADIVVANRFICHMDSATAKQCLIKVLNLVKPGGYLFVSGIDEDVREEVAGRYQLTPVLDALEEVYYGDPSLVEGWPFHYWGIEPINHKRQNWPLRYAPVFKVPEVAADRVSRDYSSLDWSKSTDAAECD